MDLFLLSIKSDDMKEIFLHVITGCKETIGFSSTFISSFISFTLEFIFRCLSGRFQYKSLNARYGRLFPQGALVPQIVHKLTNNIIAS